MLKSDSLMPGSDRRLVQKEIDQLAPLTWDDLKHLVEKEQLKCGPQ